MACYSLEILFCRQFRFPAVTHGLCFRNCHLHICSLQDPHNCALTRLSFAIWRPSPLPSSLFPPPPFLLFSRINFSCPPFSRVYFLDYFFQRLTTLPHYNFQYISHRNTNSVQRPHEPAGRNFLLP